MPALKRRIAASILLFVQAALLLVFSFFALEDGNGNMLAGRLDFFASFLVVMLGVLVWRGWLPAVIAAAVLCVAELVLGLPLWLLSALLWGVVLGSAVSIFALAAPLVPATVFAVPTVILLGSVLWSRAHPPIAAPSRAPSSSSV